MQYPRPLDPRLDAEAGDPPLRDQPAQICATFTAIIDHGYGKRMPLALEAAL